MGIQCRERRFVHEHLVDGTPSTTNPTKKDVEGFEMIIKDEIHGTIEFDELEEAVINTSPFQRLRRIKQMSVTNLVYPGANHTRFEHSIGTSHLAALMARRVGLKNEDVQKVKLYGLLHDIGHTPFSHEGEDVLKQHVGNHEALGEKIVLSGEIADAISQQYKPREIVAVGKSQLGSIVTSDFGADRMDYLKRDALNTGVAYGIVDIDRILHTLVMREEKGKQRICIGKGGLEAAEYLLVARFVMFSAVYLHRTVRIATAMLYRALEKAIEDGIDPINLAGMDDEQANAEIMKTRGAKYARALQTRQLYKEVCTLPKDEIGSDVKARKLERQLSSEFGCDIIVDYPHSFFKPVDMDVEFDGKLVPIMKLSKLIQSLKEAEEGRLGALVLASEGDKTRYGQKIRQKLM